MAAFVFIIAFMTIPIPAARSCSDLCGKGTSGILLGSFAGYGTFRIVRAINVKLVTAVVMAGLMADWATSLVTFARPGVGIRGGSPYPPSVMKIVIAFSSTEVSLGIVEGVITAGMRVLLHKRRPNFLIKVRVINPEEVTA